jgi:E-phenylitaconyl-CoA hydratase
LNALHPAAHRELARAFDEYAADPELRVAIVTGAGDRAFSAGADLKSPQSDAVPLAGERELPGGSDSLTATLVTTKPIVCAFNGLAFGGGLEIGLACDVRIAASHARFALREVRVGTIPGSGGTQRLPRLIGQAQAAYLMMTGDDIDAAQALRCGLVSHVVPFAELHDCAWSIARRIAANAPLAVRAVKALLRDGAPLPINDALALERAAWARLRDSEDRAEGRAAFREKRPPRYRGG